MYLGEMNEKIKSTKSTEAEEAGNWWTGMPSD